mgnify:CR=1 FL=1
MCGEKSAGGSSGDRSCDGLDRITHELTALKRGERLRRRHFPESDFPGKSLEQTVDEPFVWDHFETFVGLQENALAIGTPVLNLRFSADLFSSPEGRGAMRDLIDAARILYIERDSGSLEGFFEPKVATWRADLLDVRDMSSRVRDDMPRLKAYQADGQGLAPGFPALAEAVFPTEEGAAIFVAGKSSGNLSFGNPQNRPARIDGFNIIGASTGGAIAVNGYAQYLQIGNNRITGNAGAFGGGIRIGHPQLTNEQVVLAELLGGEAGFF